MTDGAILRPGPGRPGVLLLGVAAGIGLTFSVIVGLASLSVDVPGLIRSLPSGEWAVDGHRHLTAAEAVLTGRDPYGVDGFLYSPLGAWVLAPLAALGTPAGLIVFLVARFVLLAWFLADATKPWPPLARIVAAALALTWVFLLDDLWMGNVSIVLVSSVWLAISRDRVAAGIPLGFVMATVAKPLLIPFMIWMFVYRRRGLAGSLVTAAVVTAAAIVVLGPMPYVAYLETLTHASGTAWAFPGNLGLSASAPQLLLPASAGAIGLFLVLIWRSRDESAVLMWSLLVGLIAAPYVPLYGPVPVLAGVFPFVRAHPVRALALAAIVVPLMYFNLMAATIVALVLTVPSDLLPTSIAAPRPDRSEDA